MFGRKKLSVTQSVNAISGAVADAESARKSAEEAAARAHKAADNAEGPHTFSWNGKSSTGKQLPDGDAYALRVTPLDVNGKQIASVTTATGVVTRVENIDGQTILTLGNAKALLSNITGVSAAPTT